MVSPGYSVGRALGRWHVARRADRGPGSHEVFFVRLAVQNIDMPPIGLPSGNSLLKDLCSISQASIVLFLVFIARGARGRVAPSPEFLDKSVPRSVLLELFKLLPLRLGDDPDHFLV